MNIEFKPLKPGVHEAKIVVTCGSLKEEIQLKGRGLGGNPVAGLPTEKPLTELQESFATAALPAGWSTFIASGYESWKFQPSTLDATNTVATMDISATSWDLGMAYLITPCLNNPEKFVPEISFDLAILLGKSLFVTTSCMVYLIAPDGSMGKPIFTIDYSKQPEYAALKKVTVKSPQAPKGKYFVGIAYKGAPTASYSTALEVDNIQIKSVENVTTTEVTTDEAQVWRSSDVISFSGMNGRKLSVYALDGSLLISFPEAQEGSITLVDAAQRVVVRYGNDSVVL